MPQTSSISPFRSSPARLLGRIAALTGLGLASLLAGCSGGVTASSAPATTPTTPASTSTPVSYAAVTGNWRFTTTSPRLSALSGSLTVTGSAVTGTLHPVAGACLGILPSRTAGFPVAGTIDSTGTLTLSSSANGFPGGAVSISGTLAPDQHSLQNPVITVTGGTCASLSALPSLAVPSPKNLPAVMSAQQYQALTGTYTGTLTSDSGGSLSLTATLSQGASPDSDGNYHLTGNATFSDTSCIGAPVITDSVVSGNQISATYTDPSTGNTVTGQGTFSADAQTLTISSWTLSGSCGSDTGFGSLLRSSQ